MTVAITTGLCRRQERVKVKIQGQVIRPKEYLRVEDARRYVSLAILPRYSRLVPLRSQKGSSFGALLLLKYPFFHIVNSFMTSVLMWRFLGQFQRYRRTIADRTAVADQDGK